jgi:transposase
MTRATKGIVQAIVEALLEARLTEEQATELFQQGQEAVVFTLMTTSKELASKQDASASPSKPSGMVAPYEKPTISPRRKRPGGRLGHRGSRRKTPEHIDQHKEHRLDCCPDCQGPLKRCKETRTRYVEDIPEDMSPVVTEHTVHRDWCPQCGKRVEPRVTDALPKATLGNRTLVLSAWLHYALGNTLSQILEVFNHHLQLKLSHGGLVQMW